MTGTQIVLILVSLVVASIGAYEVVACREDERRRGGK